MNPTPPTALRKVFFADYTGAKTLAGTADTYFGPFDMTGFKSMAVTAKCDGALSVYVLQGFGASLTVDTLNYDVIGSAMSVPGAFGSGAGIAEIVTLTQPFVKIKVTNAGAATQNFRLTVVGIP